MNYILFDDKTWDDLRPLTSTKPVSELRVGILRIKEKWDKYLNTNCSYLTKNYLSSKYAVNFDDNNFMINSSLLPDNNLINAIKDLPLNSMLVSENSILAAHCKKKQSVKFDDFSDLKSINYNQPYLKINKPWDLFKLNGDAIIDDFKLLTTNRKSQKISATNKVLYPENIFIEEGAQIECAILNASNGPIYIGKDAEVMEGTAIRGPFALCDHATTKLNTKIYGPTTIGPHSKVGGEVNNSIFIGYSNKAHDGFIGNSVIGEWCNIGADSNNSNLKNNYAEVRLWNYSSGRFDKTGLQFCGLIMGDHSKCAINTMFNTGTVVGVSANIFGAGFPRNFVPDFSWGGAHGFTEYALNKSYEVAEIAMERRNIPFDDKEKEILKNVFNLTAEFRKF